MSIKRIAALAGLPAAILTFIIWTQAWAGLIVIGIAVLIVLFIMGLLGEIK